MTDHSGSLKLHVQKRHWLHIRPGWFYATGHLKRRDIWPRYDFKWASLLLSWGSREKKNEVWSNCERYLPRQVTIKVVRQTTRPFVWARGIRKSILWSLMCSKFTDKYKIFSSVYQHTMKAQKKRFKYIYTSKKEIAQNNGSLEQKGARSSWEGSPVVFYSPANNLTTIYVADPTNLITRREKKRASILLNSW